VIYFRPQFTLQLTGPSATSSLPLHRDGHQHSAQPPPHRTGTTATSSSDERSQPSRQVRRAAIQGRRGHAIERMLPPQVADPSGSTAARASTVSSTAAPVLEARRAAWAAPRPVPPPCCGYALPAASVAWSPALTPARGFGIPWILSVRKFETKCSVQIFSPTNDVVKLAYKVDIGTQSTVMHAHLRIAFCIDIQFAIPDFQFH